MTDSEYSLLQNWCDEKIKEGKHKYAASQNRYDGWKEVFLVMKSKLKREYERSCNDNNRNEKV